MDMQEIKSKIICPNKYLHILPHDGDSFQKTDSPQPKSVDGYCYYMCHVKNIP